MKIISIIKNQVRRYLRRTFYCSDRRDIAFHLCRGNGVEIGPMSNPYAFHASNNVVYADIATEQELREYRKGNPIVGLYAGPMPPIEIILTRPTFSFPEEYQGRFDFVFSSNVLEHHPNPVFFLLDQLKVLRGGGIVYCQVPNKNFMYDAPRNPTQSQVFVDKYFSGKFEVSIDEAREIVTGTGPHKHYDLLKQNVEESVRGIVAAKDGTHHINVFERQNTYELLEFIMKKRKDVDIAHFSCLSNAMIEFALKIAV